MSFTKRHWVNKKGFDDFVQQKGKTDSSPKWRQLAVANAAIIGKGIIILLSGPPGVGKTLTAEASRCACQP